MVGTLGPRALSWGWVAPGSPVLVERTVWVLGVGGAYLLTPGEEVEAVQPLRSCLACIQASTSQVLPLLVTRGGHTLPQPSMVGSGCSGITQGLPEWFRGGLGWIRPEYG